MQNYLVVDKLVKNFGSQTVVDNISFKVKKGEILGFLGPNGAGKSTTMRMITGYLPPLSGLVEICGVDIKKDPIAAQESIGYLPEGGPLYNDMTAFSFLNFIADIRGLKGARKKERLDFVIEKLYLDKVLFQEIDTLSKGYRRRVALAQAIIHDPKLLILDEPTDGLDPNQKFEVNQLIASMKKEKAIIISTHVLDEVDELCDRAIIINKGKIVSEGTPQEIAANYGQKNVIKIKFIDKPSSSHIKKFANIANVENVIEKDGNILTITASDGNLVLSEVNRVILQEGWQICELYSKTSHLNDAFRNLTAANNEEK